MASEMQVFFRLNLNNVVMDLREEIIKNITSLVKTSPKTQMQIAKELGVSNQTVTDYIHGNSIPTLVGFVKLCNVLDCNYEDILGKLE